MKGGLRAVSSIPKPFHDYRNDFIGGTSAGAIAAVAAAAECRRVRTGSNIGFKTIENSGSGLAGQSSRSEFTKLFSLFAPNRATKRVFSVITSVLGNRPISSKILSAATRAIGLYPIAAILGWGPGILLALRSRILSHDTVPVVMWIVVGAIIAIVGAMVGIITRLIHEFVTNFPENNYGLYNGMVEPHDANSSTKEPLTVWLFNYLNKIADQTPERPLTFHNLWNPKGTENLNPEKEINLEMMTTNLTQVDLIVYRFATMMI